MREIYPYNPDSAMHRELYDMLAWNYRDYYPSLDGPFIVAECDQSGYERLRIICVSFERGWKRCHEQMVRATQ